MERSVRNYDFRERTHLVERVAQKPTVQLATLSRFVFRCGCSGCGLSLDKAWRLDLCCCLYHPTNNCKHVLFVLMFAYVSVGSVFVKLVEGEIVASFIKPISY